MEGAVPSTPSPGIHRALLPGDAPEAPAGTQDTQDKPLTSSTRSEGSQQGLQGSQPHTASAGYNI